MSAHDPSRSGLRLRPTAKRDERSPQASRPDEEVWLLRCEGASYRFRLIPDMAAQVERINQSRRSLDPHRRTSVIGGEADIPDARSNVR